MLQNAFFFLLKLWAVITTFPHITVPIQTVYIGNKGVEIIGEKTSAD